MIFCTDLLPALQQSFLVSSQRATEEIDKVQKINASDIARLEAALKKADLQIQSLENNLDQKVYVIYEHLLDTQK